MPTPYTRTAARARARLLARLAIVDGSLVGFLLGLAVGQGGMLGSHWPTYTLVLRMAFAVSIAVCFVSAMALLRHMHVTYKAWCDTFDDVVLMDRWDRYVTRKLGL